MEVKIGIRDVSREVTLNVHQTIAEVLSDYSAARATDGLMTLTDASGRQMVIPANGIGYIEFGQEHARPVGFGT
ncbi:MAG: DUF3107 domain-containing protein [Propionibacteriaceae bacterium]|nr:DUF3107 domain-containing protein [Propionibacteriaceae bacterium]